MSKYLVEHFKGSTIENQSFGIFFSTMQLKDCDMDGKLKPHTKINLSFRNDNL